jgi:hypothetical protein
MKILGRHPITDRSMLAEVQNELLDIDRTQIVVWVSIGQKRRFPALLDTGHSHNTSISRRHLQWWSGAELEQIGELAIGRERVPQFDAQVDSTEALKEYSQPKPILWRCHRGSPSSTMLHPKPRGYRSLDSGPSSATS